VRLETAAELLAPALLLAAALFFLILRGRENLGEAL
jgi:hypothetical protein